MESPAKSEGGTLYCSVCDGEGKVDNVPCKTCSGTGNAVAEDDSPEKEEKIDIQNTCWDARRSVINPYSDFMTLWDKIIMLILMWTAVVTPFEVSFMEPAYNHMFVLNRIIDAIFFMDICMTFFLDPIGTTELTTDGFPDHYKIAMAYLQGDPSTTDDPPIFIS